jgi:hypothetical protein
VVILRLIMLLVVGVPLPALCPNCGAIFPSAFGSMLPGNAQRVMFAGNTETCPFCGGEARTAEGVFDFTNHVITTVSAPHITLAMLAAFGAAVRRAYKEKKPPEELAREVEKIDPSFGAAIRKSGNSGFYLTALLMIILYTIHSCSLKVNLDVNQLIDQLQHTSPAAVISAPEPPTMEPRPDQPPP